jgi:hypothetical protein
VTVCEGRGEAAWQGQGGQAQVTVPFPLRFPLAFDGKLLGQVVRIFTDTVAGWYRRRHIDRGLPPGETGAGTVIQRANSDLRLNPHLHTIFLDGVYSDLHQLSEARSSMAWLMYLRDPTLSCANVGPKSPYSSRTIDVARSSSSTGSR